MLALPVPLNLPPLSLWFLPVVGEAVLPGVTLAAEGGLHLAPALAPQSPPSHGHTLDLAPAPTAAPAPTHDPGLRTHTHTHSFHHFWGHYTIQPQH